MHGGGGSLSRGSHGVNHNCPLWRSHGGLISGTQGNDAEDYCRTGNWQEVFTLPVSSGLLHNGDAGGVGCQLSKRIAPAPKDTGRVRVFLPR
jgi:hypothetical protein